MYTNVVPKIVVYLIVMNCPQPGGSVCIIGVR